nr:MAG: hypothetical protein [Bacteriophage sp.]
MPPFKVYKVMQDINQQLYENKSTPEGFIPVYGVVVTVPTGIYISGQKEFTCDKTFDEVKEILLKGGSIIAVDNNNSRVNFDRIDVGSNDISATITYFSACGGIHKIDLSWDKGIARVGGEETKSINTFVAIGSLSLVNNYNIGAIITKILNSATKGEVLTAINSKFTNFNGFTSVINKPNSIFYDDNGKYSVRVSGGVIVIVWDADTYIGHVTIDNTGAYTYNTIQIVDKTLYRLSNLTIEPIVNPKIWVGTATQYAAIAQKDNNTTYIVKSDA